MLIFASRPGRVVRLTGIYSDLMGGGGAPPDDEAMLSVLDEEITYDTHTCIVQGFGMSQSGNYQVSNAIGKRIYVYTFGDQIGDFQLQVACFLRDCKVNRSGIPGILDFYARNRLSERLAPLGICLAPGTGHYWTFSSYLVGYQLNARNPEYNVALATLTFMQVPFDLAADPDAPEIPDNMI